MYEFLKIPAFWYMTPCIWHTISNASKQRNATISRVNCWYLYVNIHGVIYHSGMFMNMAARNTNLALIHAPLSPK